MALCVPGCWTEHSSVTQEVRHATSRLARSDRRSGGYAHDDGLYDEDPGTDDNAEPGLDRAIGDDTSATDRPSERCESGGDTDGRRVRRYARRDRAHARRDPDSAPGDRDGRYGPYGAGVAGVLADLSRLPHGHGEGRRPARRPHHRVRGQLQIIE